MLGGAVLDCTQWALVHSGVLHQRLSDILATSASTAEMFLSGLPAVWCCGAQTCLGAAISGHSIFPDWGCHGCSLILPALYFDSRV